MITFLIWTNSLPPLSEKKIAILKVNKYNLPPLKSCLQLDLDDAYYLVHLQQYIFQ